MKTLLVIVLSIFSLTALGGDGEGNGGGGPRINIGEEKSHFIEFDLGTIEEIEFKNDTVWKNYQELEELLSLTHKKTPFKDLKIKIYPHRTKIKTIKLK